MPEPGPVVHISTATTWRGGEQQAYFLARGLHQRGIATRVVAQPGSPMAERCRGAGLQVDEIRLRGELDLLGMWRLGRHLRRVNASLVHAHDGHGVTHAAFGARLGGGIRRLCTRRVDFALKSAWKYRWGMDRVICISRAIQGICATGGVPLASMSVVPSGIDLDRVRNLETDRAALRATLGELPKKKKLFLLNVASLTDHKGQAYLLRAMPRILVAVPQAKLLIAGAGELEGSLKALANELALDEDVLEFLGFREDVPALLHASDLFVMSSHLEGLCTSVMDAMAAGCAPVVTNAGGLPEVVEHNRTGVVVPARDPDALALGVIELLADRKKRERVAREAQREAESRFGFEAMVDGTLAVYRELIPGLAAG